jgi:hypothetical protein
MATATVLLSSPAIVEGNHVEFSTMFYPPSNVAGRSCYLKVTSVSIVHTKSTTALDPHETYFITMDLPQPYSFASVNAVNNGSAVAFNQDHSRNRVVATFTTGLVPPSQLITPTRILVDIPSGPQSLTIQVWKACDKITTDYDQVTVFAEITPIDNGFEPDIQI